MFERYESLKAAWIAAHPNATPRQYQDAMRQIADRMGL